MNQFQFAYKIIVIGDVGVGKTFMIKKFVNNEIPTRNMPTIGIEFAKKVVTLKNGSKVVTQIWDTAGQEKYKAICQNQYRDALGAVLVFDLTRFKTFQSCITWIEEFKTHGSENALILLVGNKKDLVDSNPDSRQVETHSAEMFAKEYGM